jgi:hypothetical protein
MKFAHHMTTMLRATAVAVSAAALVAPAAAAMARGTTGDKSDAVSRYITNHGAPVQLQGVRFITDTLAPGGGGTDVVSRYVTNHGAQAQQASVRFITDTLGGNGGVTASAKPLPDAVDRWVATHGASSTNDVQGYRFIADTLGGNGRVAVSAKPPADVVDRWLATHSVSPANGVQGYRFITDTLGGNGGAAASAPAVGGTGLDWGALGMGVGLGVLLSAFLVGALRIGRARRLAHS